MSTRRGYFWTIFALLFFSTGCYAGINTITQTSRSAEDTSLSGDDISFQGLSGEQVISLDAGQTLTLYVLIAGSPYTGSLDCQLKINDEAVILANNTEATGDWGTLSCLSGTITYTCQVPDSASQSLVSSSSLSSLALTGALLATSDETARQEANLLVTIHSSPPLSGSVNLSLPVVEGEVEPTTCEYSEECTDPEYPLCTYGVCRSFSESYVGSTCTQLGADCGDSEGKICLPHNYQGGECSLYCVDILNMTSIGPQDVATCNEDQYASTWFSNDDITCCIPDDMYDCLLAAMMDGEGDGGSESGHCNDGYDNDGNGFIDCADAACAGETYCGPEGAGNCTDSIDNDGDGDQDCADDGCTGISYCEGATELTCNDYSDNDGDGLGDCNDPDCSVSQDCVNGGTHCGFNGYCDIPQGENHFNCPSDCSCGDGKCDPYEDSGRCYSDCGYSNPSFSYGQSELFAISGEGFPTFLTKAFESTDSDGYKGFFEHAAVCDANPPSEPQFLKGYPHNWNPGQKINENLPVCHSVYDLYKGAGAPDKSLQLRIYEHTGVTYFDPYLPNYQPSGSLPFFNASPGNHYSVDVAQFGLVQLEDWQGASIRYNRYGAYDEVYFKIYTEDQIPASDGYNAISASLTISRIKVEDTTVSGSPYHFIVIVKLFKPLDGDGTEMGSEYCGDDGLPYYLVWVVNGDCAW